VAGRHLLGDGDARSEVGAGGANVVSMMAHWLREEAAWIGSELREQTNGLSGVVGQKPSGAGSSTGTDIESD